MQIDQTFYAEKKWIISYSKKEKIVDQVLKNICNSIRILSS